MHDDFWLEEKQQGQFSAFGDIMRGEPGPYFTPSVDENGNISWTNNGNLPNPQTQNIKGPSGKSAYQQAVEGGYIGTEAEFDGELANLKSYAQQAESARSDAITAANTAGSYSSQARQAVNQAQSAMNAAQRAAASVAASAAQIGQNASDISDLKSAVEDVSQATTATTLGPAAVVTFDASAADMPLKGLTVDIEPVQEGSGDPSPENVRPITGWTGCNVTRSGSNLLDPDIIEFGSYDQNASPTVNGDNRYRRLTMALPAGDFVFHTDLENAYVIRAFVDDTLSGTVIDFATFSFSLSKPGVLKIAFRNVDTTEITEPFNSQINIGTTLADYESYHGTTYPITFPTSAGTVYGGTLTINADGSGELVVDTAKKKIKDMNLSYITASNVFRTNGASNYTTTVDGLCSCYKTTYEALSSMPDQTIKFMVRSWDSNGRIAIKDSRFTTVDALIAAVGDEEVVFKYSPTAYPLTAEQITTLLGTNNIWSDTGDIIVTYGAYLETVKAHAERLGDSILGAIAPLEASYTASRAYAVGSFLFVGTKFYKVISAIAEGGTITPGTNVTQTTVAEQLVTLFDNVFMITKQPENAKVNTGDPATFSVEATGASAYQWQYSATGTEKWRNCGEVSAKSATYEIAEADAVYKSLYYRCVLTGINGAMLYTDVVRIEDA